MSQDLKNPYFHQPYHVENPFSTINTTFRQMGSSSTTSCFNMQDDDVNSSIILDDYSYPSHYMSFNDTSFLLPGSSSVDHDHDDLLSSVFGVNNYRAANEETKQVCATAASTENDQVIITTTNNSTILMEEEGVLAIGLGDEDSNTCNNNNKDKQVIKGSQEDEETPTKETKKSKKKGTEKKKEKERQSRFAFMTKSEIDHLEDGYRWRKYGQKAVKNSPYPRSYYRCTTQKCTVKKRVERSLQDPTIVITTYEGTHNHHVPSNLRGNINVAACGLLHPSMFAPSYTPHHHHAAAAAGSSFLPELFAQMQQVYGHGHGHGGGGVTTSSGSGSNSNSNSSTMYDHHQQQQTLLPTPFQQHMQFPDCGLLQDIVPSSIFLKQEHYSI